MRSLILSGFYNLKILFKATLCQFLPYNFSKTWKLDLITFWVLALNLFLHCCRFFKTMPSTSSNLLNLNQDHPSKNLLRHEGFFASSVSSAKKAHLEYCKYWLVSSIIPKYFCQLIWVTFEVLLTTNVMVCWLFD